MSIYTVNPAKSRTLGYNDSPLLGRQNHAISTSKINLNDPDNIELEPFKLVSLSPRSQQARDIVQDGTVRELKDFLSDNSNVKSLNNLDEEGVSLLHLSVRLNRVEVTRTLIDYGANVNIRLGNGTTPLHVAARFNCAAVAEILVHSGANPSLVDENGNNALHQAARRSSKGVMEILLRDSDIDIDAKTHVGMTPLHLVCMNGDLEMCRLLLRHGAEITSKTADCSTPLHIAIFNNCNTEVAELLIKEATAKLMNVRQYVNETDMDQDRALHLAVETGNVRAVELCLKHGAQINAQRSTLMTPLHMAAMKGDLETVEILCKMGADLHLKDNEKQTPLHRAANGNCVNVIKYLLSLGAQIDMKADNNLTPFLLAVAAGRIESARIFLESGADVRACTSEMKHCLHLAVENGHLEMVQLLVEDSKAVENLSQLDVWERVPLHNAAISPNIKILELLLTKYSRASFRDHNQQTPLHLAAQCGLVAHVEALAKGMSGLNERDDHGMTPIHLAAMHGNRKACQVLTRLGSDVNTRDSDRWTPLMWAARSGCDKTSQALLDKQAILDHVNNRGDTALHIASSHGKVRVVELLLNVGANVCLRNSQGQSCLDVAVLSGAGDVALAIAQNKRWPEILENRDPSQDPPMKILIEHFPEAASLVMDQCIKRSSHIKTDPSYTENYDFHFLDPGPDSEDCLDGKRFFGPTTMVKYNREGLLLHPLTQKLLDVKWASFGRFIYYFNLITYLVFLITYTIFVITERNAQDFNPFKQQQNGTRRVDVADIFGKSTAFNEGVLFISVVFASAHVIKEIFQLVMQRRQYFKDPSNVTDWALYVTTLCFMMPFLLPLDQLESAFGDLQNPRNLWITGIFSIFLCYINAILFLRRFQLFGIYVNMFLEVTKTVARVMIVFFIFIFAFSIVFFILFKEQDSFRNIGFSIVKVSVMMIGEFEYDTTFVESINSSSETTTNPLNPFPEISMVFIYIFLFLMSIILMNLLVGLAVGDIESVQRNATLQRMAMQVSFVVEVEDKYPKIVTRRIYNPSLQLKPNAHKNKLRRLHDWLAGQASFFEKSPSLTAYEEMTESNIKEIQQQVCKTKKRVKALMRTMENQNRLLVLMAKKMDLNVEADDLDAKNALSEIELLEPRSLGNNESDDDKKDRKTEVAGL